MSLEELHPDKPRSFSTKGLCSAAAWRIPAKPHLQGRSCSEHLACLGLFEVSHRNKEKLQLIMLM